jgi:hypothetical protein
VRARWIAGALALALALPALGQSADGWDTEAGARLESGDATLPAAGARLETVARRGRHHAKAKARAKAAPAISRAQMELAREMVDDSYALGKRLELRQRVALMMRLLYTMRPEVMAEEKRRWAEELFALAQELPAAGADGYEARDAAPAAGAGVPTFAKGGQIWATRNNAIAIAAARVAVYDSDRALELLDTLPSEGGRREDARTMASRLVFATYMQHHGAAGAQTLLAHGRKWGEHGGFPYEASAAALARLRTDEDAAEDFFRQTQAVFARGQEGVFGVREFAGLLDRAVAMEAISDESAEEAGRMVVAQMSKLTGMETAAKDAASSDAEGAQSESLTDEEQRQVAEALNDVRLSAPKAYITAAKDWPGLFAVGAARAARAGSGSGNTLLPVAGASVGNALLPAAGVAVDAGLQASFGELAEAMREHSGPEVLREVIAKGLQRVNARYRMGECGECVSPDAQSWALVSLAAYASPMTIAAQLKPIEEPFWRAYFLAIAAQQVGEPTRVADPTARRVLGKEEAEPE